ncbi:MAG: PDZ domain-containing protein [Polyangiaceae bacterium]
MARPRLAPFVFALALPSSLALAACGEPNELGKEPLTPAKAAEVAPPPKAPRAKVTQLSRAGVQETVRGGIGRFLQDVTLDDNPAFRNGKFLGFRVVELRGDLEATELQPGDVIVRVNGQAIEHPEEALAVFQALPKAKELVVDYERGGKPQTIRLPIVD